MGNLSFWRACLIRLLLVGPLPATAAVGDPAGTEAAGIVLGLQRESSPSLTMNSKTGRIEIRDSSGSLLEEIPSGTTGKIFDFGQQEYRLSFGRDEEGRASLLVRPGPAMKKPVVIRVFGRKSVLSPEASLVATIGKDDLTYFEPSLCGEVYYVEPDGYLGGEVSRRATLMRETAILAKPTSPLANQPGQPDPASEYKKEMESAGQAVKSAFFTLFGLPDKQATQKARVYRLKSTADLAPDPTTQVVPAAAGRP